MIDAVDYIATPVQRSRTAAVQIVRVLAAQLFHYIGQLRIGNAAAPVSAAVHRAYYVFQRPELSYRRGFSLSASNG